jgi:dCTP diphosphatase
MRISKKPTSRTKFPSEMEDKTTTVLDLRNRVRQFVESRQWKRFHSPKNLAMAVAVEAAELLDLFKWQSERQSVKLAEVQRTRDEISDELADVFIYCLTMANRIGLDMSGAVDRKIRVNERHYPLELNKARLTRVRSDVTVGKRRR